MSSEDLHQMHPELARECEDAILGIANAVRLYDHVIGLATSGDSWFSNKDDAFRAITRRIYAIADQYLRYTIPEMRPVFVRHWKQHA